MAIHMRGISVYTVKFIDEDGIQHLEDFQAAGTWDAEQKWKVKYPTARLVNIFRAQ